MKLKIFAVYDSKAEAYLQPFFMPSRGTALRAFTDAVNDPQGSFQKHAADYTLFELGEYNDADASITELTPKVNLANARELLKDQTPSRDNTPIIMNGDY
ncbi:MAG: hypothetical protein EOO38_15670 [Cytophagaceae bacterium]|nr:MAG: hypothetical protein EOO38_15670 [Cytophagaceae bacterium]